MSKRHIDDVVYFHLSTGYVNCQSEERSTLGDYFDQDELDGMTEYEFQEAMNDFFNEWLHEHHMGWSVGEGDE